MWSKRLTARQREIVEAYWAKQPQPVRIRPLETGGFWGRPRQWLVVAPSFMILIGMQIRSLPFALFTAIISIAYLAWTMWEIRRGNSVEHLFQHGRKVLKPANCFLCGNCHYDLNGSPDEGKCPECGTAYQRATLVEAWRQAYQIDERYPLSASEEGEARGGGDRSRANA